VCFVQGKPALDPFASNLIGGPGFGASGVRASGVRAYYLNYFPKRSLNSKA